MDKIEDLTGRRFGKLVVLQYSHRVNKRHFWKCRCDCGTVKDIAGDSIMHGTSSCGCLRGPKSHKMSHSKLYGVWQSMLTRCNNPKSKEYHNYGARGIKVCDDWQNDFTWFQAQMGEPPPGHWLERIDNDGDYTPDNCKWATPTEQHNNKRTNVKITYKGETRTAAEWSRHLGLHVDTIGRRLRYGWALDKVFSK